MIVALFEALKKSVVTITEIHENGEELVGAKQDRILNTTILVASHSTIVIPVSCVEQALDSMPDNRMYGKSSPSNTQSTESAQGHIPCPISMKT